MIGRAASGDERRDAAELASDRFLVAFEVVLGGVRLRGATPLAAHAEIDRLPPIGNLFTLGGDPLPLVDLAGAPSGITIVELAFEPTALEATLAEPAGRHR